VVNTSWLAGEDVDIRGRDKMATGLTLEEGKRIFWRTSNRLSPAENTESRTINPAHNKQFILTLSTVVYTYD
jgi:hypothetical protein